MISRRESLGLVAGMAFASKPCAQAKTVIGASDRWTESQEGVLHALMKLRAALDERVTLEWVKGIVYGVVDSAITPLFTVNAVAFASYRQSEDGEFSGRRVEVTYHGDLEHDRLIEHFENPYTGETVDVPLSRTPLQDVSIGHSGLVMPASIGPLRVEAETCLGPGLVNGERCWVRLDTRVSLLANGVASPVNEYGESMSYCGENHAVLDPKVLSASCQISYTNAMTWRPWLQMQGSPGHTLTIASGEKVESLEDVPAELRAFVRVHHPDLAEGAREVLSARLPGAL